MSDIKPNIPDKIIVHHDGVSRVGPSFDIINEYHKGREFPLSSLGHYVGYHYWIEADGTVRQARIESEEGAHTFGQNFSSVGIGMAGNFDVEWPSLPQIEALSKLMSEVANRHGIQPLAIFPHRHFANKTCYGSRLDNNWARELFIKYERARMDKAEHDISIGVQ